MNLELVSRTDSFKAVSYADVKSQLRLTQDLEQSLIEQFYIPAANSYAEKITQRTLAPASYKLHLKSFSQKIFLLKPPVIGSVVVKYFDNDENEQTFSGYDLFQNNYQAFLTKNSSDSFPSLSVEKPYPIVIEYDAGYGVDPTVIPSEIRQAILLLTAHFFMNREAVVVGIGSIPGALTVPHGIQNLLNHWRVYEKCSIQE